MKRKDLHLEDHQIEMIQALRSVAPYGPPPFVVVVRQLVDEALARKIEQMTPNVLARFNKIIGRTQRKVVSIGRKKEDAEPE